MSQAPPSQPELPPATQASNLVASLHRLLALFELFTKSSSPKEAQTLVETLRRAPIYFARATRLLFSPTPSSPDPGKATLPQSLIVELDHVLHQVRSMLNRFIRTPTASSGKIPTLLRSEELVTLVGASKPIPVPTDPVLAEIHRLVRAALNAFVVLAERSTFASSIAVSGQEEEEDRSREAQDRSRLLRAKGVETLILLAHDNLSISDRSTHSIAFSFLSRCLPLLRKRSNSNEKEEGNGLDLELYYSIHSVASVFYNVAARLFSSKNTKGDGAMTVRFVRESCRLTKEVLGRFEQEDRKEEDEGTLVEGMKGLGIGSEGKGSGEGVREKEKEKREDRDRTRRDLEKTAGRRWELLGLAQHVIEDRKVRTYEQGHGRWFELITSSSDRRRTKLTWLRFSPNRLCCSLPSSPMLLNNPYRRSSKPTLHCAS